MKQYKDQPLLDEAKLFKQDYIKKQYKEEADDEYKEEKDVIFRRINAGKEKNDKINEIKIIIKLYTQDKDIMTLPRHRLIKLVALHSVILNHGTKTWKLGEDTINEFYGALTPAELLLKDK